MTEITLEVRDTDADRLEKMAADGFLDDDVLSIEVMQTIREAWDSYQQQLEQRQQQEEMMASMQDGTETAGETEE